jgi:hypothetical protein
LPEATGASVGNESEEDHAVRPAQLAAFSLAFVAGVATLAGSAVAQYKIDKFAVTVGTIPPCDVFPPAPAAVSGNVGIYLGGGPIGVGPLPADPFSSVPSLAGSSPYVFLGGGGTIVYNAPKPSRYLRILWGSVGPDDLLTFLDPSGVTIGQISGADLISAGIQFNTNNYLIFRALIRFSSIMLNEPGFAFEYSDVTFASGAPKCP